LDVPRQLRIESEGAVDRVRARGDARQEVVRDERDGRRLIDGLERAAVRRGWELLGYVTMSDHFHLLLKTPRQNLGAGMRSLVTG
jgi:REP element-mobilizing transposase RayT